MVLILKPSADKIKACLRKVLPQYCFIYEAPGNCQWNVIPQSKWRKKRRFDIPNDNYEKFFSFPCQIKFFKWVCFEVCRVKLFPVLKLFPILKLFPVLMLFCKSLDHLNWKEVVSCIHSSSSKICF